MELEEATGLTKLQVKDWFQNYRGQQKRKALKEADSTASKSSRLQPSPILPPAPLLDCSNVNRLMDTSISPAPIVPTNQSSQNAQSEQENIPVSGLASLSQRAWRPSNSDVWNRVINTSAVDSTIPNFNTFPFIDTTTQPIPNFNTFPFVETTAQSIPNFNTFPVMATTTQSLANATQIGTQAVVDQDGSLLDLFDFDSILADFNVDGLTFPH